MQLQQQKYQGLVGDLLPNIRWMQASGHFLFKFVNGPILLRKIYSSMHFVLVLTQFVFIVINLAQNTDEVNELTANTITTLFFVHCITKFIYFAVNSGGFYRTLNIWNQSNTHPLFAESDARYHTIALSKMRRLLLLIIILTMLSVAAWTTVTFFGESTKLVMNHDTNVTEKVVIPRLPFKSFYPWPAMSGTFYYVSFGIQVTEILFRCHILSRI